MAEATLNYQTIRTTHAAREADDLRVENRKKNLIILVLQWLAEEGYIESARQLEHETNLDVSKYDVCDNIDLDTILQEYESYFYIKFNRHPKLIKKNGTNGIFTSKISAKLASSQPIVRPSNLPSLPRVANNGTNPSTTVSSGPLNRPPSAGDALRKISYNRKLNRSISEKTNTQTTSFSGSQNSSQQLGNISNTQSTNSLEEMSLSFMKISSVKTASSSSNEQQQQQQQQQSQQNGNKKKFPNTIIDCRAIINDTLRAPVEDNVDPTDRLLKPLGGFNGYNSEWRELAEVVSRDIYLHDPSVRWDSIIGLDAAKRTIKEAVVYPIRYPQLFTGILSPWKALLLYGPPGTGKTLLAKAVATECKTTFFNISASTIVSKWRGDSEKLVRVLFELARFHAPSTIFLDELDAIMSQRGGGGNTGSEHEGSRRMKTELLVQLDGLAKSDDLVFLLAASNLPWELDHAMLRRLEKRVLVDLPSKEARRAMFQQFLPPTVIRESNGLVLFSDLDYTRLSNCTEGYSGADIKLVCKEAAMNPVRKVFDILENLRDDAELGQCIQLESITTADVEKVLSTTKPSARAFKDKYTQWQKEFESV